MAAVVRAVSEADHVLAHAGAFLARDPVRHNLILTLLRSRAARPQPGRYWVVEIDGAVVGVAFQSPLHFVATVTPMPRAAVTAVVDAMVDDGVGLPGVNGEASTAAHFAGHWAERTRSPVHPVQGQRIYEVGPVIPPRPVPGEARHGVGDDRGVLVEWLAAFQAELGDAVSDPADVVDLRLPTGQLWVWDDDGPSSMAGISDAAAGVVRVGPVYTPPPRRNCGYASALVAAMATTAGARGERCILYTELDNPTSNSIYRAIGFRAAAEVLRYRFGDST